MQIDFGECVDLPSHKLAFAVPGDFYTQKLLASGGGQGHPELGIRKYEAWDSPTEKDEYLFLILSL